MLADEQQRARYDAHGASGLQSNFIDAGVFFTMLFGSERFETYIGTLRLASAASMEGAISLHRLQVRQRKREVECALKLVETLAPYVRGDDEAFRAWALSESKELASVSFGGCLLYVVAEIYACRAAEYLGHGEGFLGVDGHLAALKTKRVSIENHAAAAGAGLRAASAAVRTYKIAKEIADKRAAEEGSAAQAPPDMSALSPTQLKATQDSLPVFLEAMWHVSVVDIEHTLTEITHKAREIARDCARDGGQDMRGRSAHGMNLTRRAHRCARTTQWARRSVASARRASP